MAMIQSKKLLKIFTYAKTLKAKTFSIVRNRKTSLLTAT